MAKLGDLVTVLYRPRETMRRVLDGSDRWAPQVVVLAYICASVNDPDPRELMALLPDPGLPALALIALALIAGAIVWVIALYLVSWIGTFVGRWLGGVANTADLRAAMAWGIAPMIWSVLYRVPLGIAARRFHLAANTDQTSAALNFFAEGGCSLVVILLACQAVLIAWSLWVTSCCVAEAQRFSTGKGFANVAIVLAAPVVLALAVIASRHVHL